MNIQSLVALTTGAKNSSSLLQQSSQLQTISETNNEPSPQTFTSTNATGEEFQTFLTLLTAQIKNQDPLAPLDSTQFVEQLATFSSLELQAKGNQTLDQIVALLREQSDN